MQLERHVGVVGSRKFNNYHQLAEVLNTEIKEGDILVSGGAVGTDSMAQRWAKENGHAIMIYYPNYKRYTSGAPFVRNKQIAEDSDFIFAFYARGSMSQGGTRNTIEWAIKLGKPFIEIEEKLGSTD